MALDVHSGPLSLDGQVVDPSTQLEAWVNGTTVFNLPHGAFVGSTLQFVLSQSEPPATSERTPGMLWFKRGEGILYIYDNPTSGISAASGPNEFIAIAGRKEIWARAVLQPGAVLGPNSVGPPIGFPVPLGCPLTPIVASPATNPGSVFLAPDFYPSGFAAPLGFHQYEGFPFRPVWAMFPHTRDASGYSTGPVSEMTFIAAVSRPADVHFAAVEVGFCLARVGCGYTGAGGFVGFQGSGEGLIGLDSLFGNSQSPVSEVEGFTPVGILCDSTASLNTTNWTRLIFKWPQPVIVNTGAF